jgi:hypothetical protein
MAERPHCSSPSSHYRDALLQSDTTCAEKRLEAQEARIPENRALKTSIFLATVRESVAVVDALTHATFFLEAYAFPYLG